MSTEWLTTEVAGWSLCAAGWVAALILWRGREQARFERDLARERGRDLEAGEERLRERFEALAGDALERNNTRFMQLARETLSASEARVSTEFERRRVAVDALIGPLDKALSKTQLELNRISRENTGVEVQIQRMIDANRELRTETGKLSRALRKPNVRGRWGELQLERVVELSGMRSYCDFTTQANVSTEGGVLRPDLVVRLPNNRVVVVDAKANVEQYLEAIDADTAEAAKVHLKRFAQLVANQAAELSRKEYWAQFEATPEFVVMFIPGDQFVDAALEYKPDLIELATRSNIVLASPSTLIGLLRAVHAGWREKELSDNARELLGLGRELHSRAVSALGHASELGGALRTAVGRYNKFVGSMESRLLPTLRRFEERGGTSGNKLQDPDRIDDVIRPTAVRKVKSKPAKAADPTS